ncbi:hypothetical protein ACJX0J_016836 [Zea mays]
MSRRYLRTNITLVTLKFGGKKVANIALSVVIQTWRNFRIYLHFSYFLSFMFYLNKKLYVGCINACALAILDVGRLLLRGLSSITAAVPYISEQREYSLPVSTKHVSLNLSGDKIFNLQIKLKHYILQGGHMSLSIKLRCPLVTKFRNFYSMTAYEKTKVE